MVENNSENKILFENEAFKILEQYVNSKSISRVYLLLDLNTEAYCLDYFKRQIGFDFETIVIPSGETYKTLDTCADIWQILSDKGADRQSLLINLGGGVITDIGGFVASCYRRGINFVHIPSTLLGMVDAALGGKNGVDFKNLKNQIGVIRQPELILIDKHFLKTLPQNQIISGYAEVIKHGLINIKSEEYFKSSLALSNINHKTIRQLIEESITIKNSIVNQDSNENGIRKILNYGHTLGHAIESYRMSLDSSKHLLHGEAVAIGLILETYISHKTYAFPVSHLNALTSFVKKFYEHQSFDSNEISKIIELMKYDKKNVGSQINFVLLKGIGNYVLDCQVDNKLIYEAFDYYNKN